MAFPNTSRSYTNLGQATSGDNKNSSASLNTFASAGKPWNSSNIWGSGSLSNGISTRNTTRDNSTTRDVDEIPGKTGSGSLVDNSVSDDWGYSQRNQRSAQSSRSISQVRLPDSAAAQNRSLSNAGLPQAQPALPYATRPPTVNLNASSGLYRPTFSSGFPTDRNSDQPPNVYTKFDRPLDPLSKKNDSAIVSWPDALPTPSPTDERRPFAFGKPSNSLPESRNPSQPPSRHEHDNSFFSNPDFAHRSAHTSASNSSRAPSISSQRNGLYGNAFAPKPADGLVSQFGQMRLGQSESRPSTSYRSSVANGFPSAPNAHTPVSRPGTSGTSASRVDELEETSAQDRYNSYAEMNNPYGTRFTPNPGLEFRNGQPVVAGRPFDVPGLLNTEWQLYGNAALTQNRRSPNLAEHQLYIDPRIQYMMAAQLRNPYAMYNAYGIPGGLSMNAPYMPMTPMQLHGMEHVSDARENAGHGVQSALMYEFKSNTKSKRYELKDIYDHIAEFSGDQHGSRFIQTKLETANSDEKERVFREIEPNTIPLMTDVFGNYVIQKFFEHGDQTHKKILANKMRGQVCNLSLQMYGCRVVQKALDHVLVDQQAQLVSELDGNVLKCVKDQNGNHVIQKAIERCPAHTIGFIIEAFRGQVQHLSIHPYGCRVIQRCLERADTPHKAMIMSELMDGIQGMISDQYGNYVVQHIVTKDDGPGRQRVLQIVAKGLEGYSKHKFASNVVEKCLERADDRWRREVLYSMLSSNQRSTRVEGEGVLVGFLKDNYGNYVIQKLLDTLSPEDHATFVEHLHPAVNVAKRTGCGKQIISIEKKMHKFSHPPFRSNSIPNGSGYDPMAPGSFQVPLPTPPFSSHYGSVANTPPLPLGNDVLQNVHADTMEGAAASRKGSEPSIDSMSLHHTYTR